MTYASDSTETCEALFVSFEAQAAEKPGLPDLRSALKRVFRHSLLLEEKAPRLSPAAGQIASRRTPISIGTFAVIRPMDRRFPTKCRRMGCCAGDGGHLGR